MSDLETFRADTRKWLEANYPAGPEPRRACDDDDNSIWGGRRAKFKNKDAKLWLDRMAEKGWTAPTWPKEYGGGGLSAAEARVLQQELGRIKARPALMSFGIWMLGPVLLEYASEEQKREYLPKIVRGEIRWCQGYSEPGAGSDLASLRTKCEDKGDHFLINGQKIWTSYADQRRLDFLSGAHRHFEEARRHFLRPVRHDDAGCRGAADQADLGFVAVLRDVLHRCEGAEEPTGRQTQWRLGDRQAASAI